MSYTQTVWVNREPPSINATNLNHIEQGVFDANVFSTVSVVTDTTNIGANDGLVVLNKSSAFTVTLPVAVVGKVFSLKNIGVGTVTVDGYADDTIDGAANQDVYQWACMTIQCRAANTWAII